MKQNQIMFHPSPLLVAVMAREHAIKKYRLKHLLKKIEQVML